MPEDSVKNEPVRDKSALQLKALVDECGLVDVGDIFRGNQVQFTHFQGQSHARLHRVYISSDVMSMCCNYAVKHVSFSDHSFVMFEIGRKRKVSAFNWELWKLNEQLLTDDTFVQIVREKLEIVSTSHTNFIEAWEQFKCEVKLSAIDRSCILRHKEKQKENELQCTLDFLLNAETTIPGLFKS